MNQRITLLALKASDPKTGWLDRQKFAELLIKECISTLEEKIHRSIDHEGDEIWADLILKEHFGVEE